jgi:hypothetical protein
MYVPSRSVTACTEFAPLCGIGDMRAHLRVATVAGARCSCGSNSDGTSMARTGGLRVRQWRARQRGSRDARSWGAVSSGPTRRGRIGDARHATWGQGARRIAQCDPIFFCMGTFSGTHQRLWSSRKGLPPEQTWEQGVRLDEIYEQ